MTGYERTREDPIQIERTGSSPVIVAVLFVVLGLALCVGSMLAFPAAEQMEGDAGAFAFTAALSGGIFAMLGVYIGGQRIAQAGYLIGQPGRVALEQGPSGLDVVVDRHHLAAEQLLRVAVQQVPAGEGPDRFMVGLVFAFVVVELNLPDGALAMELGQGFARQLGRPAPQLRQRQVFDGSYAWGPLGAILLAIFGQMGVVIGMLLAGPESMGDVAPFVLGELALAGLVYGVSLASGKRTTLAYLRAEYGVELEGREGWV